MPGILPSPSTFYPEPVIDPAWLPIFNEYAAVVGHNRSCGDSNPIAGNVTHSSWHMPEGPIVFAEAKGVTKYDCNGRLYRDLWMGHGALLLGNAHPAVVEAVKEQVAKGQHVGGAHRLHGEWASRIQKTFPSCERVRFTGSGTEATLLALRVARAWTGQPKILRIDGHFHGWHDDAFAHVVPDFSGINPGVASWVSIAPPNDVDAVAEELSSGDIAALILEPGGGSAGSLPWSDDYLRSLRRLTESAGVLLIFDEVISGFRYAPGGVQEIAGVRPDLTILAKIAAGGFPGGIVAGRSEIMDVLGGALNEKGQRVTVPHTGTFNGFPLTAAAALVTIDLVADGSAQLQATDMTRRLVKGINDAAIALDVDVRVFHQSSIFHILIGSCRGGILVEPGPHAILQQQKYSDAYTLLRCALLLENVDCHRSHGWISATHSANEIDAVTGGFSRAFARLRSLDAFRLQ